MPPIRVLHIVTIMDRGGLETMLMTQYRKIDREKVQYDFLEHRKERGAYDDEIEALGGRIFRASPLTIFNIPAYLVWLKKFFLAHPEYNIAHSAISELSVFPLLAAKMANVATRVAHSHIARVESDWKLFFRVISKQFIPFVATDLFACSVAASDWCFGKKNRPRVKIIPNAIDSALFRYDSQRRATVRESLRVSNNFVIGHIGRFFPQKNHHFLLEIFKQVYNCDSSARLLLVGDGPLMQDIQKEAEILGDSVMFLGVRGDAADLYQAMDTFVLPSFFEGLPLVGVEAQAAGLPCFFSDGVSSEAILVNETEMVPLSQSPQYWASRILSCKNARRLDNTDDMIKAKFDIFAVVQDMQKFYIERGNHVRFINTP